MHSTELIEIDSLGTGEGMRIQKCRNHLKTLFSLISIIGGREKTNAHNFFYLADERDNCDRHS